MSIPTIIYATDEDIALRAPTDFPLLCPRDQKIAVGTDGAFLASDPWTLTSATVNFQAVGASAGQIVLLQSTATGQPACEDAFAVVSAAPGAVTLRRKGQAAGVGMPPGTAAGLVGLRFRIVTFGPQIALASDDLNRRFGIANGLYPGRFASELADPGELRDAVVLTVLNRQYLDVSREVAGPSDTFAAKARAVKADLDDVLARITLHWSRMSGDDDLAPPTTRFSTLMSR